VRTLLREDEIGRVKFAALQSEPAQRLLAARGLPVRDFDSLVFVSDWNDPVAACSFRTNGVCDVLDEVGGVCRLVSWTRLVPRRWRDMLYRIVARIRFTVFGQFKGGADAYTGWPGRFLDR
jgi:predicted DCC family thiol-disulfide oxidoreductase YuxK